MDNIKKFLWSLCIIILLGWIMVRHTKLSGKPKSLRKWGPLRGWLCKSQSSQKRIWSKEVGVVTQAVIFVVNLNQWTICCFHAQWQKWFGGSSLCALVNMTCPSIEQYDSWIRTALPRREKFYMFSLQSSAGQYGMLAITLVLKRNLSRTLTKFFVFGLHIYEILGRTSSWRGAEGHWSWRGGRDEDDGKCDAQPGEQASSKDDHRRRCREVLNLQKGVELDGEVWGFLSVGGCSLMMRFECPVNRIA